MDAARRPAPDLGQRPTALGVRSLGVQLALATALLIALVTASVYVALTRHERASLLDAKSRAGSMVTELFAQTLSPALVFEDREGVAESLAYLRSNPEIEQAAAFALDARGQATERLADYQRARATSLAPLAPHPRERLAFRDGSLFTSALIRDPQGKALGMVLLRFSLAREEQTFRLLSQRILQVAALVSLVLTALLLLLARVSIIGPLRALKLSANALQSGAHEGAGRLALLPVRSRSEIGDLARAFAAMAEAIARREREIATQNREMRLVLESVGQGFLITAADGTVVGQHSAIVDRWFGVVRAGSPLWEVLSQHDPAQAEWLELAWSNFGTLGMPDELVLEQLPKRFQAEERTFDVEYRTSVDARGAIEQIVVVISDVTELCARERAEREQRELAGVLGCIASDRGEFVTFFAEARGLLERVMHARSRHELLADLHTLKGNAGLYQLRGLSDLCESIETRLVADGGDLSVSERQALLESFERTRASLGPLLGPGEEQELTLRRRDVEALEAALARGQTAERSAELLAHALAEPAELVFGRLSARLQLLARTFGKCRVDVRSDGRGIRFPRRTFAPLWAVLVHALRNIADHALETTLERERAHKSPVAHVELTAELTDGALVIRVADDGRGVDLERVRERAQALGLHLSSERELLDALFAPEFSTADAGQVLSGRGMGLTAIRAAARALGGDAVMASERGAGSELRITLPRELAVV